MYLSNLTHQHRLLSVPLMVVLVVSWCLLLCSPPLQAAQAHDHQESAPAQEAAPPCHEEAAQTQGIQEEPQSAHDCPSCDAQPEPATGFGVPAMILSTLDWMQSLTAPPVQTAVAASLPPDTHPPPARLHLLKAVFLI